MPREAVPDGIYLVRFLRMQFRKYAPKSYYTVDLSILEPTRFAGSIVFSRVYRHAKDSGR